MQQYFSKSPIAYNHYNCYPSPYHSAVKQLLIVCFFTDPKSATRVCPLELALRFRLSIKAAPTEKGHSVWSVVLGATPTRQRIDWTLLRLINKVYNPYKEISEINKSLSEIVKMLVNSSEVISFQKIETRPHYSPFDIIIAVAFVIGLIGNLAALWILYKTAKRRNKKHLFMLRCLAINDLVAQLGMLMVINLRKNQILPVYWTCVGLVVLRAFGLGSGCVAFVMAFERWLALTRPFLYHQVSLNIAVYFGVANSQKKCII